MQPYRSIFCFSLALCLGSVCLAQSLKLEPLNGPAVNLSMDELKRLPVEHISARDHDSQKSFDAIPFASVLDKLGAPKGKDLHGKAMAYVLIVEARDGYRVAFALTDFDNDFTDRQAYFAIGRDGAPLPEPEGPFRIVIPGDKRPARWIRQVEKIRLVEVK